MLVTGQDNVKFYSGKQKVDNAVTNAVGLYAQKAIGTIPIVQWSPYELLFQIFQKTYLIVVMLHTDALHLLHLLM